MLSKLTYETELKKIDTERYKHAPTVITILAN